MKRIFALLLVAGLSMSIFAAENAEDSNQGRNRRRGGERREMNGGMRRRGGFGGGFFGGGSMLQRFKAEQEISRKFPKEYADAEKQLFEAEQKLRELAQKAKVTLPDSMESKIRTLKHKQPEAFAKIAAEEDTRKAMADTMKLAKDNGIELFPAMNRMRPGSGEQRPERVERPEGRRSGRVNFSKLRKLYPEEMKKLESVKQSDPKAYTAGLRELVKKMETEDAASKKQ